MIVIDWGTTNFRAYLLDKEQKIIDKIVENQGLLSVLNRNFSEVLFNSIKNWSAIVNLSDTPVYMAGMVGSKQGWHETDYLSAPLNLTEITNHLYHFKLPWLADAFIVPGVCGINRFGFYDVMRGEETQLLGLTNFVIQNNIAVILPGTHSKHAILNGTKIIEFSTLMTGEVFSLLNQYSILTKNLPEEYGDQTAFLSGVENGYGLPLNAVLFSARTLLLNNTLSPNAIRSYLSGLLIGNELALLGKQSCFYIVGGQDISQRYYNALRHLNKAAHVVDGECCFLAGIKQLQQ